MNVLEARRRLLGAGVYKKTVTGNPAIAQDSLARMYPGIEMEGWTEQLTTTGAQLSYIEKGSYESNGLGKIDYESRARIFSPFLLTKTVTFSVSNGYKIYVRKFLNGSLATDGYWTNKVSIIYDGTEYTLTAVIKRDDEENITDKDISDAKFMLNEGSTALPWEPYTGGQPSPSPEYPQDIVSAGGYNEANGKYEVELKFTGGNLIDKNTFFSFPPTTADTVKYYPMKVKMGEYTLSSNAPIINTCNLFLLAGNESSGALSRVNGVGFEQPRTVNSQDGYITIGLRTKSIENPNNPLDYEIMLNHGSTALPYETYKSSQTIALTSDRPLTKWDKLEKRNGQWGWVYKSKEIESYTDESVPGEYFSTTGQLSTGAQVWYETAEETFVPLSASEQEQMNALHTNRPTTVLSNDCECSMSLTYKTKKSMGGVIS